MTNRDQVVTLVHSNSLAIKDLSKYFQNTLSLKINKETKLTELTKLQDGILLKEQN